MANHSVRMRWKLLKTKDEAKSKYSAAKDVLDSLQGTVVDECFSWMTSSLVSAAVDAVDGQAVLCTVFLEVITDVWSVVYVEPTGDGKIVLFAMPNESGSLSVVVMSSRTRDMQRYWKVFPLTMRSPLPQAVVERLNFGLGVLTQLEVVPTDVGYHYWRVSGVDAVEDGVEIYVVDLTLRVPLMISRSPAV